VEGKSGSPHGARGATWMSVLLGVVGRRASGIGTTKPVPASCRSGSVS
jgi:hypothetical protein